MLRTRFWTAVLLLPVVLAFVIFSGDLLFTAFIAALAVWGLYEIGWSLSAKSFYEIAAMACLGAFPAAVVIIAGGAGWWIPLAVIAAMLTLAVYMVSSGPAAQLPRGLLLVLGTTYVGVLFPYFAILRNAPDGVAEIIVMLLIVIASDTGAYFAGVYLGTRKIWPAISPNKTVQGALGGLAASVFIGLLSGYCLLERSSLAELLGLSLAVGLLAQLGDLAGSAFKRAARVKDFGWIFPGHGGLLDRTSSLVFSAVFTYYYFQVMRS